MVLGHYIIMIVIINFKRLYAVFTLMKGNIAVVINLCANCFYLEIHSLMLLVIQKFLKL